MEYSGKYLYWGQICYTHATETLLMLSVVTPEEILQKYFQVLNMQSIARTVKKIQLKNILSV